MDNHEMVKRVENRRTAIVADEAQQQAKQASRARAEAAVKALDVNEAVKVGNQMAKDLIANFKRLHQMQPGDHPAVLHREIKGAEGEGSVTDSTFFNLGNGAFLRVKEVTFPARRRQGAPQSYNFAVSDDITDLLAPDGHPVISLGSISLGETDGFHPEVHPGLNKDGLLFNNLVNLFETTENMRTVEQQLGLESLPSTPFKLPQVA